MTERPTPPFLEALQAFHDALVELGAPFTFIGGVAVTTTQLRPDGVAAYGLRRGTRSFSSSNQFWTTWIWVGHDSMS